MSAGYGPPAVNTFGMISGLGKAFDDSYEAGMKARQEREAPEIFSKLIGIQGAPSTGGTLGSMAESYRAGGPKLPSFASTGGPMGDYLATTRATESGGNDAAKNPNSTATGRYQFTQDTWNGLARKYPDLGLTPNGRGDAAQQERAMQAFTKDNADALTRAGVPITPGNLYVSHFLGEAGGPRFITGAMQNPDAPATQFVTPGAAAANRSIFFNRDGSPKTAGAVYAERTGRFGGGESASAVAPALPGPVASSERVITMPGAPAAPASLAQAPAMQPAVAAAPAAPIAAPSTVAQADPDASNKPAVGAQPAGFVIPGQGAAPAAAPAAPQGFAGFGAPASKITPDQQAVLTAAWKNPVTRPMATAVWQQLLTGKQSQWQLSTMGDQPVLFNQATAQIVPVGQAKRSTATVGNTVIDTATGQPIYQGERDPKTATVGNTLVDLRTGQPLYQAPEKPQAVSAGASLYDQNGKLLATAPDKDKTALQSVAPGTTLYDPVARAPVFTAPKPAEPYTMSPGQVRMEGNQQVASLPDRDKSAESEAKLRQEFTKNLGTFGDVQDGYRRLIAATEQREANPSSISPASDIALVFGYMKMLDPGSVVREGEYATAQNAAGIPERVRNAYNKAMNGEFLTDSQRQDFVDTAGRLYGQARQGAEAVATRYSDLAKGQGLDEGRVVKLPDPLQGPKVAASRSSADGGETRTLPEVAKGARPPNGYTWDSYLAKSKTMLKDRPDLRPQLEDMLAKAGIDPRKLGK